MNNQKNEENFHTDLFFFAMEIMIWDFSRTFNKIYKEKQQIGDYSPIHSCQRLGFFATTIYGQKDLTYLIAENLKFNKKDISVQK